MCKLDVESLDSETRCRQSCVASTWTALQDLPQDYRWTPRGLEKIEFIHATLHLQGCYAVTASPCFETEPSNPWVRPRFEWSSDGLVTWPAEPCGSSPARAASALALGEHARRSTVVVVSVPLARSIGVGAP